MTTFANLLDFAAIPAPGAWTQGALCKGRTNEFFDWHHPVPLSLRALCQACPVNNECLSYAMEHDVRGIWAGTNWIDRERMRRRSRRAS